MSQRKKIFNHKENPVFNVFVHVGMIVKVLSALGMIFALWYYF
jgi:uncharacterized membrane protein YdbT with pleckstrin-like domain